MLNKYQNSKKALTSFMLSFLDLSQLRKKALPVQGAIRSVSPKYTFLIFLFICATAVIKKR